MTTFESETRKGSMSIDEESKYGCFEIYDTKTGGYMYYAEGGLWFDVDMKLCDFDGCYDLPQFVLEELWQNDHLDEWHLNLWCTRLGLEPTTDMGRRIAARSVS